MGHAFKEGLIESQKGQRSPSPTTTTYTVHFPFRGPWPRASPCATKPGCGSTRTVNS